MNSAFSPNYQSVLPSEVAKREPVTPELTILQGTVLDFIRDFRRSHQMPPTRAEIARHFKWASANAAECHLRALEKKGAIRLSATPRGIFDLETA